MATTISYAKVVKNLSNDDKSASTDAIDNSDAKPNLKISKSKAEVIKKNENPSFTEVNIKKVR